jgi:hypothetical protein
MITNVLRFPIAETTCFAIVGTYCGKAKGDPRDHGYLDSAERYELGRYVTKGTAERVLSEAQAKLDGAVAISVGICLARSPAAERRTSDHPGALRQGPKCVGFTTDKGSRVLPSA